MRFIFVLLALLSALPAMADYSCSADVNFKWKKEDAEQESNWGRIEAEGVEEKQTKSKLEKLLGEAKAKAADTCSKIHENTASCLATKYETMASVLNSMRFEARKALEEAIASDCTTQKGICGAVSVSEIKCEEKVSAGGTPTPEDGKKGGAKAKK